MQKAQIYLSKREDYLEDHNYPESYCFKRYGYNGSPWFYLSKKAVTLDIGEDTIELSVANWYIEIKPDDDYLKSKVERVVNLTYLDKEAKGVSWKS